MAPQTPSVDDDQPDRAWVIGLFVAALVWRLAHLLSVWQAPFFENLYIDPKMYDAWGARIAGGQLLSDAPFFLDPLYPYFVGAVYALFGRSYHAVAAVQSLLGALVPPLLLLAASPWFRRPVARVAGILAVFYPISIYYGGVLLKPALASCLVALTLWMFSRALVRGGLAWWTGAGIALGLAILTRGNLLLVAPVIAVWMVVDTTVGGSVVERLRRVGVYVAGIGLVILFPFAHNLTVSGEWIATTTNWGQIYYIGNNPTNPNGTFQELPFVRSDPVYEQVDFKTEAERRVGRTLRHREVSRFWFAEGLRWAVAQPWDWTRLMWSKLRVLWGAYETPASLDYYFYRRHAPILRLPVPGFALLGPFALLGGLLAWPRGGWPRLLVIFALATTLAIATFFVLTRFRMVVLPALFPLAAFGGVELVQRVRAAVAGTGRAAAAAMFLLFVLFVAFVNLPVRSTADTWRYRIASALHVPARLENTAGAHFNLGVTYAARAGGAPDSEALLERAEAELREAVREAPFTRHYVELGKVLARRQKNDEAIESYRAAVELDPMNYRVHHSLGLLYRRVGQVQNAEFAFREALRIAPRHVASAVELGEVLLELDRPAEAAEVFRYALRLRPEDRRARQGLAAATSR